jgi:hypothetical protein
VGIVGDEGRFKGKTRDVEEGGMNCRKGGLEDRARGDL